MTRKAELGNSRLLHSSTCSRTFSLWCNARSVDRKDVGSKGGLTGRKSTREKVAELQTEETTSSNL